MNVLNFTYNRPKINNLTVSNSLMDNSVLEEKPKTYKLFVHDGTKYAHNINNNFIYKLLIQ